MDMTKKHYIEFCDKIFAVEDILLVERYSSWNWKDDSHKEKNWQSYVYLRESKVGFYFPESEYEKLRQIIFDYLNNKEITNIEN